MLADPKMILEVLNEKPLEELIKKRNKLIEEINNFEKRYILKTVNLTKHDYEQWNIVPSPYTHYSYNCMLLSEVINMIDKKVNESKIWEEIHREYIL